MDRPAILADANGLQPLGRLPCADAVKNFSFLIQSVGRKQNSDRLTDDFLSPITKEPLCAVIPRLNDSLEVLGGDGIAGVLDDGGKLGNRFLCFALLCHVPKNKDNAC